MRVYVRLQLVADHQLARHDGPCPGQHSVCRTETESQKTAYVDSQLDHVSAMTAWQHFPQNHQQSLGQRNGPDRAVEVAPFRAFPFGGGPDAWQYSRSAQGQDDAVN